METFGLLGPVPAPAHPTRVALSAQRLAVLEHVRGRAPVGVADTAADLGLHPNTIREHLHALVAGGLVERTTAPAGRRGRPAARYRPSDADPTVEVRAFAALATALASQLARISSDPQGDALAAGIDWGRGLIDGPAPPRDPRLAVLDELARLGFAPDEVPPETPAERHGVALRRCPLLDAAHRNPDIICRVHLGVVLGMLDKLGAPASPDVDLVAFAEPGACRLHLGAGPLTAPTARPKVKT